MGKLALCCFLSFTGCAALRGQYPVAHTEKVEFKEWLMPVAPARRPSSYTDRPTFGVFTVENGTDQPFAVTVECNDLFEHELAVPPYTAQEVLVSTTISRASNHLCKVRRTAAPLVSPSQPMRVVERAPINL